MISEWEPTTGNLPPGEHLATWDEIVPRFGFTEGRRQQLQGLRRGLDALAASGCTTAWLDGSFVSSKPQPGDFDCCWDPTGVNGYALQAREPALLDFSHGRRAQKERFGGEFFLANTIELGSNRPFLEFFQVDKYSGERKGIVRIELPVQEAAELTS
jgi:hypothetical protein